MSATEVQDKAESIIISEAPVPEILKAYAKELSLKEKKKKENATTTTTPSDSSPIEVSCQRIEATAYRERVASTQAVVGLLVTDRRRVGDVLKSVRGLLLNHRNIPNVVPHPCVFHRRISSENKNENESENKDKEDVMWTYAGSRLQKDTLKSNPEKNNNKNNESDDDVVVYVEDAKLLLLDPSILSVESSSSTSCKGSEHSDLGQEDLSSNNNNNSSDSQKESVKTACVSWIESKDSCRWCPYESGVPAEIRTRLDSLVQKYNESQSTGGVSSPSSHSSSSIPIPAGLPLLALVPHEVSFKYINYTMPELLRRVLPPHVKPLSGFETVGHIAHVNLSDGHLPYKHTIGQVILDCNAATIRTVVNKLGSIASVFREFNMEVIAGEKTTVIRQHKNNNNNNNNKSMQNSSEDEGEQLLLIAEVKQSGFVFRVPYDRCYWNSRLSHEHERLVAKMSPGDVLFDVMAGVGPFAVPAAVGIDIRDETILSSSSTSSKHQNSLAGAIPVFANDLNPSAVEFMDINAQLNGVPPQRLQTFNMDGREFLKTVLFEHLCDPCKSQMTPPLKVTGEKLGIRHVSMNLPATAVEFLDVFAVPLESSSKEHIWSSAAERIHDRSVLFHVYCFSATNTNAEACEDAVQQVEWFLQQPLNRETDVSDVFLVRDVAPNKLMVCVSFQLPRGVWEGIANPAYHAAYTAADGGTYSAAASAQLRANLELSSRKRTRTPSL